MALLAFGYRLALHVYQQHGLSGFLGKVTRLVVDSMLQLNVVRWIVEKGGWVSGRGPKCPPCKPGLPCSPGCRLFVTTLSLPAGGSPGLGRNLPPHLDCGYSLRHCHGGPVCDTKILQVIVTPGGPFGVPAKTPACIPNQTSPSPLPCSGSPHPKSTEALASGHPSIRGPLPGGSFRLQQPQHYMVLTGPSGFPSCLRGL